MIRRILFHGLAYSTVLAVAVLGTAQALPGQNTVDSGDIKNRQVKTADLGKNAVTGAKVKESTLGAVPNAKSVNGLQVRTFRKTFTAATLPTRFASLGSLVLEAGCSGGDLNNVSIVATSTRDGASFQMGHISGGEGFSSTRFISQDSVANAPFDVDAGFTAFGQASLTYSNPTGEVVSVTITWDDCLIQGTMTGG